MRDMDRMGVEEETRTADVRVTYDNKLFVREDIEQKKMKIKYSEIRKEQQTKRWDRLSFVNIQDLRSKIHLETMPAME